MTRELGENTMHKDTKKRLLEHLTKKVRPRNLKEGDLVLKVFRDETFDPRGKMKPRWTILLSRRSCQELLPKLQIWMGKRCFAQLTWINSKNTTFDKKKQKEKSPLG